MIRVVLGVSLVVALGVGVAVLFLAPADIAATAAVAA
jgi:hypothetical protein